MIMNGNKTTTYTAEPPLDNTHDKAGEHNSYGSIIHLEPKKDGEKKDAKTELSVSEDPGEDRSRRDGSELRLQSNWGFSIWW